MEYKMSELVAKTNVPKSTILYYIKEGLLPEPIKVKANVHKYSDEHVELIRYIKYMQETMGSSIEQIKLVLKNKALAKAKKEHKPLFMVVVTNGCPFCEKLMDRILTKDYVREYIGKKYVTLIMNKERQKVPKKYLRPFEPVTYIIDPESEQIIDEIDGYMEEEHYLWHL